MAQPEEAARRIFSWLGLQLPAEVNRFIELHTRLAAPTPAAAVNGTGTESVNR